MANHEVAINTLLSNGLRHRQLDRVLASNCVMDWFGRTFIGQQKVIQFYQNSNACYDHSMSCVETSEAFEDRPYHILTREQPPENLKSSPEMPGDEIWFDCETHSPVNLKEGHRTPLQRSTPARCPPAPCRFGLNFHPDSDDEAESQDDDDESNLSGFRPLDTTVECLLSQTSDNSPEAKRIRREEAQETLVEPSSPIESKFSELQYLEASGVVTINRAASSDESEKRECKMFVSYRVHKDDPSVIQIALIVYKSNSNTKTRRNLMFEFEHKTDLVPTNVPSTSRCRTVMKERRKLDGKSMEISTEPSGAKFSKATKRPMVTKTSLRF